MKARVLKRLLNDTEYIISDHGEYIAVGSSYIHNLISVNKSTLKVKYALDTFNTGREAINHKPLEEIWDKLHELIESGKIHDIIEGCDDIANPLPVYTVEDGQFIETTTDEYGWPNVTIDGKIMYENTHFKTKGEAVEWGIKSTINTLKWTDENILELEAKLVKAKKQRIQYSKELDSLKALQINVLIDNKPQDNYRHCPECGGGMTLDEDTWICIHCRAAATEKIAILDEKEGK